LTAIDRRRVLAALAACGLAPVWAAPASAARPGGVTVLSAARGPDGFFLAGLTADGAVRFRTPLPGRGHGIAVSPDGAVAVAFARRPGRFAVAVDLADGRVIARFTTPADRHFLGHGAFSSDGRRLYATENDFDGDRGVIGVYAADAGFRRIGESPSGGLGPHEIIALADGRTLAVANGGILTHPDYPRRKLNLATMAPTLAHIDAESGAVLAAAALPPALHQVSIRHIRQAATGDVWWGGQYEGPAGDAVPLVGTWRPGADSLTPLPDSEGRFRALRQYVGSVCASPDGRRVAVSSPRGGLVLTWNAETREFLGQIPVEDGCGLAADGGGFLISSGTGAVRRGGAVVRRFPAVSWDNHMMAVR
jgi:hypothetical protein